MTPSYKFYTDIKSKQKQNSNKFISISISPRREIKRKTLQLNPLHQTLHLRKVYIQYSHHQHQFGPPWCVGQLSGVPFTFPRAVASGGGRRRRGRRLVGGLLHHVDLVAEA